MSFSIIIVVIVFYFRSFMIEFVGIIFFFISFDSNIVVIGFFFSIFIVKVVGSGFIFIFFIRVFGIYSFNLFWIFVGYVYNILFIKCNKRNILDYFIFKL